VLSPWPGYFVEGDLTVLPGTEDHFARWAGDKLRDPSARARLHVAGPSEIDEALRRHEARWIVVGNSIDWTLEPEELQRAGYAKVASVGRDTATLWLAQP
jgi:hypothetical protein